MPLHVAQRATRGAAYLLSSMLVLSASALVPLSDTMGAYASDSIGGRPTGQYSDMDHPEHADGAIAAMTPHQQHIGPHMRWTALRPANAGDAQRAEQIVRALRQALARYQDYRVAMEEGFAPPHPERTPRHYHFVNKQRRIMARLRFDAAEPTALLYKKTVDGYELEGAMYTAPKGLTEDELNERIPLSIAQWHAHVNLCFSSDGSKRRVNRRQFGFKGPITTEGECQAAGGRFVPQAGGWMIHVYPFKSTPAEIWTH